MPILFKHHLASKRCMRGGDHIKILEEVLQQVNVQNHVRPVIFIDQKLDFVEEKYAPGINSLRDQVKAILSEQNVQQEPHEDIIRQLDQAGDTFRILLIKTDLTLPYTSIFMRLDCGYWTDETENSLRKNIASQK